MNKMILAGLVLGLSVNTASAAGSQYVLVCEWKSPTFYNVKSFRVDESRSTVDGVAARITDGAITFSKPGINVLGNPNTSTYTIDRYSGSVDVVESPQVGITTGAPAPSSCRRAEPRDRKF